MSVVCASQLDAEGQPSGKSKVVLEVAAGGRGLQMKTPIQHDSDILFVAPVNI